MLQDSKLVGSGAVGSAEQGNSVAISGDGNTAIVGGPGDNSHAGAAWVFTRSSGVWTQQGSKLVGTGGVGAAQGWSVALSDDGNTAAVGGPGDNSHAGATWVFTRSGGVWSQQGTSWSAPGRLEVLSKAPRSHCPTTATPPSWAGMATTRTPGRRGYSPVAAVSGPSRAVSWSAPAQSGPPFKAPPLRCPATAIPPSWAGMATTRTPGPHGSSPKAAVTGASRAAS